MFSSICFFWPIWAASRRASGILKNRVPSFFSFVFFRDFADFCTNFRGGPRTFAQSLESVFFVLHNLFFAPDLFCRNYVSGPKIEVFGFYSLHLGGVLEGVLRNLFHLHEIFSEFCSPQTAPVNFRLGPCVGLFRGGPINQFSHRTGSLARRLQCTIIPSRPFG